jgi:hypothetical protein
MHGRRSPWLLIWIVALTACGTTSPGNDLATHASERFGRLSINLEQNFTDQDSEIVIFAKGRDEGLVSLKVTGPDGRTLVQLTAVESTLGTREFAMESPEPGLREVFDAYPEGTYTFRGVTVSGITLTGVAKLSHRLLDPPQFTFDESDALLRWKAVPGAAGYVIEFEREVDGRDELKLTAELPASATSLPIPAALLVPGDYQAGVAAVSEDGNLIVVEQEFSIGR